MIVAFELSMPSNNAWDGKWSGDGECYAIVRSFRKGWPTVKGTPIHSYFTYSFGDGWVAAVSVRQVERGEAQKIRNRSRGFCGYDWMVESILESNRIDVPKRIR